MADSNAAEVAKRLIDEMHDGTAAKDLEAWAREAEITMARLLKKPMDGTKIVHAGFALHGYRQGTKECIAFNRGVRFSEREA